MGWSLSGLVINKTFDKDSKKVLDFLKIKDSQKAIRISFEEASTHFWPDEKIVIGFFGKGTLIFSGIALMTDEERLTNASKTGDILSFYINDNNATYCFDYYSQGSYLRRKWVSETDEDVNKTGSMGELLSFENIDEDPQEEAFKAIEQIMGQSFYEISEEEAMFEYKIKIT